MAEKKKEATGTKSTPPVKPVSKPGEAKPSQQPGCAPPQKGKGK